MDHAEQALCPCCGASGNLEFPDALDLRTPEGVDHATRYIRHHNHLYMADAISSDAYQVRVPRWLVDAMQGAPLPRPLAETGHQTVAERADAVAGRVRRLS